jgi:hypothetical protein
MDFRRLTHPLPLFLIFLFVAVAIADLAHKLTQESPPPLQLVGSAVPRFEVLEPVIDLRPDPGDATIEFLPIPELVQGQWSSPLSSGVWARGPAAELEVDLATGGHRVLVLEAMPTRGKESPHAVQLDLNGVDCGRVALEPGWGEYRFELPDGAARPGPNRVALGFPETGKEKRKPRKLLVRRLGFFLEDECDVEILHAARAVSFDSDADSVTIRRSGILEIPLVLEDRTDALQMRYRFSSGVGRADVEVAQSQSEEAGSDDAVRSSVTAHEKASGRIRLPLHGRRGTYVLRIRAELIMPGNRLLISSLRLVEEGDPTRRPRTANPPRN